MCVQRFFFFFFLKLPFQDFFLIFTEIAVVVTMTTPCVGEKKARS